MRAALTTRSTRRLAALAATGSMLAVMLLGTPASAEPVGSTGPGVAPASAAALSTVAGDDAAAYLVSQLIEGNHLESSYLDQGTTISYADQGLTADAVFALLAHGGYQGSVEAMVAWLGTQVVAYADPAPAITPTTNPLYVGPYSGALAKLALVAESTGANPHQFGGVDLLGIVSGKVCTGPDAAGTCTAAGEFYQAFSTTSQALGVLALQASPIQSDHLTIDSPPVLRLAQLQCRDGGFSSPLIALGDACTSDIDSTGYAIQALSAVAGTDLWLGKAQQFLLAAQSASGLFPGAQLTDNSNSTALAAVGLQTLTEALSAPTAPSNDPALAAPIAAWQASLTGLGTLAVSGGGFGISDTSAPDARSTTQALQAVSRATLVSLSGAPLRSAPRIPLVVPPATTEPSASVPAISTPGTSAPTLMPTAPDLAATGPEHATSLSLVGAVLVALGALALVLVRPAAQRTRRH